MKSGCSTTSTIETPHMGELLRTGTVQLLEMSGHAVSDAKEPPPAPAAEPPGMVAENGFTTLATQARGGCHSHFGSAYVKVGQA